MILVSALALALSPAWAAAVTPAKKAAENKTSAETYAMPLQAPTTEALTVERVVAGIETLDREMKTLSADFRQSVKWDDSGMAQSVEGAIEFAKPERLHLEHRLPEPQTLVSDGDLLWIYRPSTNQVVKTRLAEWKRSEVMAQALLDFGNYTGLMQRYAVTLSSVSAPGADGHREVELELRPRVKMGGDFSLTLKLSTRDWFPADARLRAGAVTVRSIFSKIKYNAPLAEERFKFAPPPGADLFDTVKPKAK